MILNIGIFLYELILFWSYIKLKMKLCEIDLFIMLHCKKECVVSFCREKQEHHFDRWHQYNIRIPIILFLSKINLYHGFDKPCAQNFTLFLLIPGPIIPDADGEVRYPKSPMCLNSRTGFFVISYIAAIATANTMSEVSRLKGLLWEGQE